MASFIRLDTEPRAYKVHRTYTAAAFYALRYKRRDRIFERWLKRVMTVGSR